MVAAPTRVIAPPHFTRVIAGAAAAPRAFPALPSAAFLRDPVLMRAFAPQVVAGVTAFSVLRFSPPRGRPRKERRSSTAGTIAGRARRQPTTQSERCADVSEIITGIFVATNEGSRFPPRPSACSAPSPPLWQATPDTWKGSIARAISFNHEAR